MIQYNQKFHLYIHSRNFWYNYSKLIIFLINYRVHLQLVSWQGLLSNQAQRRRRRERGARSPPTPPTKPVESVTSLATSFGHSQFYQHHIKTNTIWFTNTFHMQTNLTFFSQDWSTVIFLMMLLPCRKSCFFLDLNWMKTWRKKELWRDGVISDTPFQRKMLANKSLKFWLPLSFIPNGDASHFH